MAEHKLAAGLALIDGLKNLGQGLGYFTQGEHPIKDKGSNPPAVDVAWKADEAQPVPLLIFEVESVAGNAMANNAVKVFAQPREKFEKPLFFFHVVLKSGDDNSPIENLKLQYGAANYGLYRIDHNELDLLIRDILSQHRRHQRAIDLLRLYEDLHHEAWQGIDLDGVFECVQALGFQTNYLSSYALLARHNQLFEKRFLQYLLTWEESNSDGKAGEYETYFGQTWSKPIHLALLAQGFGDGKNSFLERLRHWQERSSYMSQIGPHFGLAQDYDQFVLGISPSYFALVAAVWGNSSDARSYISDQVEIIMKAVLEAPDRVSCFISVWLLHITAGIKSDRTYEFVRAFLNEHGGVSTKCLYRPRFLIALDDETEWDEDLKEAAILVPDRNEFVKMVLNNYPAPPTASDAISLGVDALIQPEYTDGFADRTIALLVPRG